MPERQPRDAPVIVLDTNVLVAGLCRRASSPSYRLLTNIQGGRVPIALTNKLYLEYEAVLKREEVLELTRLSSQDVEVVLDALVFLASESAVHYLWRPNLADSDDDFILEAAVSTGAVIVTKNVRDFHGGELRFPELCVVTPQEFCDRYL